LLPVLPPLAVVFPDLQCVQGAFIERHTQKRASPTQVSIVSVAHDQVPGEIRPPHAHVRGRGSQRAVDIDFEPVACRYQRYQHPLPGAEDVVDKYLPPSPGCRRAKCRENQIVAALSNLNCSRASRPVEGQEGA
jgi:hypothetical protein